MKREKIIFAFFVIPIFLFSASLQHWKLDREKNRNSVFFPQQIILLKKVQSLQSKGNKSGLDHVSPRTKPDSPEQAKEAPREASRSIKAERIMPRRNRSLRYERTRRPDRSVIRHKIKHMNRSLPFRYEGPQYVPDEILVKFKPTLSEQTIKATITAYQSKKLKRISRIDVYKIQIQKSTTLEETLYALRRNPDVEYAEPNYITYVAETPNDPLFEYQYALSNPGSGPPGSPQEKERPDIKATAAWEETKGDEDIIIAVLDTGVDYNHEDLAAKIWINQPEYNGVNGIDDDGNGYTDDIYGYDFVNDDGDPMDDNAHGTHVAGIAAAETDNGIGIAGVAWNCKILPAKIMDDQGEGVYSDMSEAIIWAADNGAHVINLSLGGDFPSQTLENALKIAYDKNIVIVAAAGNDAGAVIYPAAYDDYCLAVAATDDNDSRWVWSNFGPEIDVAAPGVDILSLVPSWFPGQVPPWDPGDIPYGWIGDGTSMATPHVAGLAALIKSVKPWLTASEIMNVIRYTADDVNSANNLGRDDYIGYGRINMKKALVPIVIKASK
jgi:subtilisin family serine protease